MKKVLAIFIFTLSLTAQSATYYIDPSGSDNASSNGSKAYPWKTLAYACSKVKTAGDIIHVNPGTYNESVQSMLSVGVSIEGEGIISNIVSSISNLYVFTILLSSNNQATDGHQHISNLKMDGNGLTAYGAIRVARRKNVEIYNCTFVDFNYYGVSFINGEPPATYATGNKFHHNTVINCSGYHSGNQGSLEIQGQDGMLIYNNTITQNRANGLNGDIIYGVEGYLKNVKIYDNILNKTYLPGTTRWDFAIEFWNCLGGVEIFRNNITGSIDLVNSTKGSSAYSVWVHDNIIGQPTLLASESTRGILLEASAEDIIIESNYITTVSTGIFFSQVQSSRIVKNISIICNIINNIGVSDRGSDNKGWGINWTEEALHNHTVDNINISNNVFNGSTGARSNMWGIQLPNIGTATNVSVRNNIIQNFDYASIYTRAHAGVEFIDNLSIENNIFFHNGHNNTPSFSGITPTHYTYQNNLITNPAFLSLSDFHLSSGSPAIGKGIKIAGLTADYDNITFEDPPSIGAFEYYSPEMPVYKSSKIENSTPSILEMIYTVTLSNIVPAPASFNVRVNSESRTVNSVKISENKVLLTLSTAVKFGDIITISYTRPAINALQSTTGTEAVSIVTKPVTNNCKDPAKPNYPPVVVTKYESEVFSGFVSEIDATETFDANNDILSYTWTIPDDISVSSTSDSKISFLAPIVNESRNIEFQLKVSDGVNIESRRIPVSIMPYKPELYLARLTNVEASDNQPPDSPKNIYDGNLATKWSAKGDNQWFVVHLSKSYKINHLEIAFLQGQKYSSYFDIYASKDNIIWDPVLINETTCNFSGNAQVFEFPLQVTNTSYLYVKLIGHGNSLDNLNNISEFKILGLPQNVSGTGDSNEKNIVLYPNPARDFFNISIEEPKIDPDLIRLIDISGNIVFENSIKQGIKNVQIPITLKSGMYIVELKSGNLTLYTHKLLVDR